MKSVMVRRLGAALFAGVISIAAAHADELDEIIKRGKVLVAIDITAAPFGVQNDQMQPDGADVETAKLLAKDLGVQLEIVPVTSANRIAYLQSKRVDITMSSLSVTPERAKAVAFSTPYGAISAVILAPQATAIKEPKDLSGKRISVARGTTNEADVVAIAPPDATILRFDDEASAQNALATGQADAYSTGEPLALPLIKRYPDRKYEGKILLRRSFYAAAMRRDEPALRQWVNTFIWFHLNNGDLGKIYQKWVGAPLPTMPPL
jgi:polar amino acid transport system substrate-binding protein